MIHLNSQRVAMQTLLVLLWKKCTKLLNISVIWDALSFIAALKPLKFSNRMNRCNITQIPPYHQPHVPSGKVWAWISRTCLQNSALNWGAWAFNVKSNRFRVKGSLTARLDVLLNVRGSPATTERGKQNSRQANPENRGHVLQWCRV